MWLNKFKIALVQNDIKHLEELVSNLPKFDTIEEMQEASMLIKQARDMLISLKNKTIHDINKMKKKINFLKSSMHHKSDPKEKVSFDITS
ncbi:MAG: hypothetical protein ABGW74_04510 [Campylobacterales bacterium]